MEDSNVTNSDVEDDVIDADNEEWTPLHEFSAVGVPGPLIEWLQTTPVKTVKLYLVTRYDGSEYTPLIVCIEQVQYSTETTILDRLKTMEHLLEARADPNDCAGHPGYKGFSPLQAAALYNFPLAIPILVKYGADLTHRWAGFTAIHLAAQTWSSESIACLIDLGADVNERTFKSNDVPDASTCLHVALCGTAHPKVGNLEQTIEMLLSAGIDTEAEDSNGRTASKLALSIENFQGLMNEPDRPSAIINWWKRNNYIRLYEYAERYRAGGEDLSEHTTRYLFNIVVMKEICSFM